MLKPEAAEIAKQVIALARVVEACRETLDDPDADDYDKHRAGLTLLAAHEILNRLKYVIDTEDMREMEDRFNEVGTFKVPVM